MVKGKFSKFHIGKKESLALSPQDAVIINFVVGFLLKQRDCCAKLTSIYHNCQHNIKANLHPYKIKYCLLLLRIKGLVRFDNRRRKMGGCWVTYVKLNKSKYKEIKEKKEYEV